MIGDRTTLVDGAGTVGHDQLRHVGPGDAMLAITIAPYTCITVEAIRLAEERGAAVITITDSAVSPNARSAAAIIIVPSATPSFIQTVAPALIAVECMAALAAAQRGKRAVAATAEAEANLACFG